MTRGAPVSLAQFEDFPLKQRRHYQEDQTVIGSLGAGLVPHSLADEQPQPVTLTRARAAHDHPASSSEDSAASTSAPHSAAADSPWQSSYQAACSGSDPLNAKKRTGRRVLATPGASPNPAPFMSGGASLTRQSEALLQAGTTRMSPHVPGYTGHISQRQTPADPVQVRDPNRNLVLENFKPFGPGYTGKRM